MAFAEAHSFPYSLISDTTKEIGRAYDAERQEGEDYYEAGIPRRISYLIDPEGVIVRAYDLAGQDLADHPAEVLADIEAASG